jgi:GDP-4-dehydro-6-deoxy-D-mannose reductase
MANTRQLNNLFATGWSGFVGTTLEAFLDEARARERFAALIPQRAPDVTDEEALVRYLSENRPDYVIHLAAQSFVPEAFENPRATFEVNFCGTLNLLQALKSTGFAGRFLFIGSGDMYGLVAPAALPIVETEPLKPRNPYAVSKVAAEALCYQWSQSEGLEIVMARPFNHLGPGQSARFVISDFAKQIVEIKLGRREPLIRTGDIDVSRDFTDVRDVVRAYLLLLEKGESGDAYNVCSAKEQSIRTLLESMLDIADVKVEITQDHERMRPSEQKRVRGDNEKLRLETGWRPEIAIQDSLADILSYWERILQ